MGTDLVFRCRVFRGDFRRPLQWQQRPQRKKLVAARFTTQSGKPQESSNHSHRARHLLRRDPLQVGISAQAAAGIYNPAQRDEPRMEAHMAGTATPGQDPEDTKCVVNERSAPGPPAVLGMTCWTSHQTFLEGDPSLSIGDCAFVRKGLSPQVIV
jgi:hypothetical protein